MNFRKYSDIQLNYHPRQLPTKPAHTQIWLERDWQWTGRERVGRYGMEGRVDVCEVIEGEGLRVARLVR